MLVVFDYTIISYFFKTRFSGDTIKPGDMLLEVQTDKAVIPFELEEEGIMAKIIVNKLSSLQIRSKKYC